MEIDAPFGEVAALLTHGEPAQVLGADEDGAAIGPLDADGVGITAAVHIAAFDDLSMIGTAGAFDGELQLCGDDVTTAVRLHGTYGFDLRRRDHFGDGLLLHRQVRQALADLLDRAALALRVQLDRERPLGAGAQDLRP